ncbi:hypothetical protein mRhiFer1_009714 [Rhinolophus ferrumequinum]|uniref:Uncharacterized protein n=1 Tax=Rhinolophus ferrumequinum TaxID=59479 RepID=A0A7J7QYJ0_RHIFE|nr:hypothetical protein mRhiFer1_009714 [Rhinolophus ferrumequinum]
MVHTGSKVKPGDRSVCRLEMQSFGGWGAILGSADLPSLKLAGPAPLSPPGPCSSSPTCSQVPDKSQGGLALGLQENLALMAAVTLGSSVPPHPVPGTKALCTAPMSGHTIAKQGVGPRARTPGSNPSPVSY